MKDKICQFLAHVSGSVQNICAEIYYHFLKEDPEHASDNLYYLVMHWDDISSDNTIEVPEHYAEKEYDDAFSSVYPVIEKLMGNLIEKNSAPDDYCSQLWGLLTNDELFATDLERICALIYVLLSPYTPYFQLSNPIRMDDEKYGKIGKEIETQIKKALFALQRRYSQRTEIASLLLEISKSIDDEEKQIVFWAVVIGYFELQQVRLIETFQKNESEDIT